MKVAIIGGGAAGLCAGRHCQDHKIDFDIFEQTGNIGGIWNYTDYTDVDEDGIPVHSPMYQNLKTNFPKEIMVFEGLSYPSSIEQSYISQKQVLDYVKTYFNKHSLQKHVKFYKTVSKIDPQEGGTWLVEFKDTKTSLKETNFYDAVLVCNGHFKKPFIPHFPGLESFPSNSWEHSFKYRSPGKYQNKRVLVVGAGYSGVDIAKHILETASKVFLSIKTPPLLPVAEGIIEKGLVKEIEGQKIIFEDGSSEVADAIIMSTGYWYDFPFLAEKCGIEVTDNWVNPLYKHIINIKYPSMAFIGLNFSVCPFVLFEIQVRFYLANLLGHFQLPTQDEMMKELEKEVKEKSNIPLKQFHMLGEKQEEYFNELADMAGIKRVKPVISKLHRRVRTRQNHNDVYRMIDDENYIQLV